MRKHRFSILYGLLLLLFTSYVVLDTFVLVRTYSDGSSSKIPLGSVLPTAEPAIVTERSYQDANITLTITEYREHSTDIYVADVHLSSPALLRTVLAQDTYGRNVTEKTSAMAKRTDLFWPSTAILRQP